MKPNAMDKRPKPKPVERKSGKIANGILRKQSLLNNNNIVKNLNDKPKKGAAAATPRRRAAPPEAAVPPLPQGCTPLMYACQQADEKLVAEILKKEVSRAADAFKPTARATHRLDNVTAPSFMSLRFIEIIIFAGIVNTKFEDTVGLGFIIVAL